MKKFSFAKIVSLIFVCALLMGAFVVSALAADGEETTQTPKIVAHNVYYGDTFQIMYAIDNAEGATLSASCVVNGETKALNVVPFLDENGVQVMASYEGVEYPAYIVKEGFAAQAIDTVVTLTVSVDGEVVAAENYSVLQYTHERLEDLAAKTPANDDEATKIDNEIAMIEAFTVYAKYAESFIDGETTISESVYVEVVDGTIDGVNNAGMFVIGSTPFANIVTTRDYDNTAYNVEWTVSVNGEEAVTLDNETVKTLSVTGDMVITAVLVESECAHEWSDATCDTLATCSKCGETTGGYAEHTWNEATCEAPKTCAVCGETEGEKADHTWGDWNIITDATCSKAGEQSKECSVCGETATEVIPATGAHADATSDGKCDGCGGIIVISYTLVTDVNNLKAGDKIIIVAADSANAMSTAQNTNNRGQVAVTKNGNSVSFTTAVQVLTLETGTTDGSLAFYTGSGYLYAASSSSNNLKTETKLSANSSWKITITDGVASVVAQGTYTRNVMQHNSTSGLFSCYSSASQKGISIYEQTITVTCAHETLENVTVVDPTCTEKGSESGTCADCGETVVKEIAATGHTEVTVPGADATCSEDGLTDGKKCSVCDEILVAQETISATGEHNDGDSNGFCDVCNADMNSDDAKAESVLGGITGPADVTEAGDIDLDVTNETGYEATITWAITGGTNTVSTLDGNKLSVVLSNSETTLVLTVSVTVGEATVTENYTINVAAEKADPVTESLATYGTTGTTGTETISWTSGDVIVTNNKASSSSAIRTSDSDHYRAYAKSELVVSCTSGNLQTIVFTTSSSSGTYATVLQASFENAGCTVTVSGSTVTVTVPEGVSTITATMTAQTRITNVQVTYLPN